MTAINRLPAVMLALLLAFLVRWAGWRRVRGRVGLLLLVFLGFFSLGLLTPWPERMLTVGGLLLVGAFMLVYAGRPQATEIDSPPTAPFLQPDPGQETETTCASAPIPDAQALQPEPTGILHEAAPEPPDFYCPYCAGTLAEDYRFCPGCGHDTRALRRCSACSARQFVPVDLETAHCVRCDEELG